MRYNILIYISKIKNIKYINLRRKKLIKRIFSQDTKDCNTRKTLVLEMESSRITEGMSIDDD